MTLRRLSLMLAVVLVVGACGDSADPPASSTTLAPDTTATATTAGTTAAPTTEAPTTTAPPTTSGEDAVPVLRAALSQASSATSGRMEGSFVIEGIEGTPGLTRIEMPFSGAFDNAAGTFAFIMDMSGIAAAMGDEIPPSFAGLFSEMEIRQIGDTAYMRFPFFSGVFGVETEWLEMPADDSAAAVSGFATASPGNPAELLAVLENANATITEVGREKVRNVDTTRYEVSFDIEALLETASPEQAAQLRAQGPLPIDELPMDIWIGDDGLVHRYAMNISGADLGAPDGEGFERMTMNFEMYDWGASIDISAPPADEVTKAEDLGFDPSMFTG